MGIDELITSYSIKLVLAGTFLLAILTGISLYSKHFSNTIKIGLFISIACIVIIITLFLVGSTIYLNSISSSKGPVHWHADFEIWACDKELDLEDPEGLSNKIGTAVLHEHNDKRIHLEGVVVEPSDASLGKFFHVIGGEITKDSITIPINKDIITISSGNPCADNNNTKLQVFVYKTENNTYSQQKLEDPASYIMSPFSTVPNGDCLIIELDTPKEKTDKLCTSYEAAESNGKIKRVD